MPRAFHEPVDLALGDLIQYGSRGGGERSPEDGIEQPAPLEPGTHGCTRWQTAIEDTTRDTLIRGLEGSGDFTAVEAGLAGSRLRLRVTTRRQLSPRSERGTCC